jgi:polyhydroxyalkanoate synthase
MMSFPIQISPENAAREIAEINQKLTKGVEILGRITDNDVQVGTAPKEVVYTDGKLKLYRYTPVVEKPFRIPILIVYALVNRYMVADLQEDRSMIRNLLEQGMDIYLIEWGDPTRKDRFLTLDDYVNDYLDGCVDFMRESLGLDKVNILGICQGGTMSTCYTALHPEKIQTLILTVTPIDFHADKEDPDVDHGLLNVWARSLDIDTMIDALGNVPAELLNFSFMLVRPMSLNIGKYTDLLDMLDSETRLMNFLRMEKWLNEGPDSAGEAYRQFVKDFFQGNKLIKNEVYLGEHQVDLRNITMPVLNVYAEYDHLVPPGSTLALAKYVGSDDYTELAIPAGHIGLYVGGKAQRMLGPGISDWVKARG